MSEYYCGGCGWPVTDHDSYCRECGGKLHEGANKNRLHELFGTPERAANTILALQICPMSKDECEELCPAHDVCFEFYKGGRTVYEMAEWLKGDAE